MDVSFLGGPLPQRGVGIVAPFDFALDRELWRWVPGRRVVAPDPNPFHSGRGQPRPGPPGQRARDAARGGPGAVRGAPEVVAYACTSGSFVGGTAGERSMCAAMSQAGEIPSLTTSGALLDALREIGAAAHRDRHPVHQVGHRLAGGLPRRGRHRGHRPRLPRADPGDLAGALPRRGRHGPRSGVDAPTHCSSAAPTCPPTTSSRSWRPSCACRCSRPTRSPCGRRCAASAKRPSAPTRPCSTRSPDAARRP